MLRRSRSRPLPLARALGTLAFAACVALACNGSPDGLAARSARPDLLLISVDTLRPDHLGAYGYRCSTSTAIDRFADRAVRYERAFSPSNWTLTSHVSMLTSLSPHAHGVESVERGLDASFVTLAERLAAAGYETSAVISWYYVSRRFGLDQGFDEFVELLPEDKTKVSDSVRAEVVVEHAIARLRRPRTAPLFLFVHLFDPHVDYDPPPPYDTMFDPGYDGEIDGRYRTLRPYIPGLHREPGPRLASRDREHVVALYDGEIRYVDSQIDRLLAALRETGREERTWVVLTSDHGEEFDEHGSMEGHQWTLYDEVIRVPLLVRGPGQAEGRVSPGLVSTLDIVPTLLEAAGLEPAADVEGRSLLAGASDAERTLFSSTRRWAPKWAIRTSNRKLILTGGPERNRFGVPVRRGYELFDLAADPAEREDLHDREAETSRALAARLREWIDAPRPRGSLAGPEARFSEEELERLRSLGYLD